MSDEQLILETIGAWVRRGVNIASTRWHDAEKKYGRQSPQERREANYLHDLVGFCMNIRSWIQRPALFANDPWSVELRELYGPGNKLGDDKLMARLDLPLETVVKERDELYEMLETMVEKGEGCITGNPNCPPDCCRYGEARALLERLKVRQ